MLLGHRYYDASTGRFLSRDPIGDGANWYAYCLNNPLKYSDKSGLAPRLSRAPVEMVWVDHDVPGIGIQESSGWGALEIIHFLLDAAGTFDPTPFCDGINAIIYVAEGDWYNASISAGGMVPYVGDGAKAGRTLSKVQKIASDAGEGATCKRLPSRKLRKIYEEGTGNTVPKDSATDRYYDMHHKKALADGGDDSASNLIPIEAGRA